jgi:hypothetical protein
MAPAGGKRLIAQAVRVGQDQHVRGELPPLHETQRREWQGGDAGQISRNGDGVTNRGQL